LRKKGALFAETLRTQAGRQSPLRLAVRKTSAFWAAFYAKSDPFAKTGSGQTEGKTRFLQGMMATRALRATGATTCSVRAWTRRLLFASVCFRLVLNLSWQTEPVLANRRFALWYKRSQQMLLVLQSAAGVLRFINQVRERPTFSTKPRISTTFS
jgi:hypothetical protein